MDSSEKLNVALLGLGRAGRFHIQSIQSIPGINLRCVVDVDEPLARRLAKELECDYSTDADGPLGQAGGRFAFKPHFGWVGAIEREPENQAKR